MAVPTSRRHPGAVAPSAESEPGRPVPRLGTGALAERHAEALEAARACVLCPRACRADRSADRRGTCGASLTPRVASVNIHHGEEPPISGRRGSGTVFFSHCNMACLFCQNYPISQMGVGRETTAEALGDRLLWIESKGAHNVNFVTPTPHIPPLIGAVASARAKGFSLPVVYNTNGYDSPEGLRLLSGVVDIYLPDVKCLSGTFAGQFGQAPDYPAHNGPAVAEMLRQVGPLAIGPDGIATHGVLVRHLVLPGRVGETLRVLSFIRRTFGPDAPLALMGQYFPAHRAPGTPGFDRKLSAREYAAAVAGAEALGLTNVFIQEIGCPGEQT